jgi:D-lactate dehydrogenase
VKIAFFGATRTDQEAFQAANALFGHQLRFLGPRLGPDTVRLAEGCEAACAFAGDDLGREALAALANLGVRVVALRCTGFGHVDLVAARDYGLAVVRVPAYSPHAIAEHTVALLLSLNRKTYEAYHRARAGNFSNDGLVGVTLHGRSAGIVGAGQVGAAVAAILAGLGCRLLVYDLAPNPMALPAGAEVVPLDRLLTESDVVSLHVPLTPATRHLIDAAAVAQMKPRVVLLNTSRAGLLDLAAVIAGLKAGRIGGLGLDLYEEDEGPFFHGLPLEGYGGEQLARLVQMPNVLVTSHQAYLTHEALDTIAVTTLGNVAAVERGEPCANRVA